MSSSGEGGGEAVLRDFAGAEVGDDVAWVVSAEQRARVDDDEAGEVSDQHMMFGQQGAGSINAAVAVREVSGAQPIRADGLPRERPRSAQVTGEQHILDARVLCS